MSILQAGAPANYGARKLVDRLMRGLTVFATLLAIIPLVLIIGYVTVIGGGALSLDFFTKTYEPPLTADSGTGAGFGNEADPLAGLDLGALTGAQPVDPNATVDPAATADPLAGLDLGALTGAQPTVEPGQEGVPPGGSDLGEKGADLAMTAQGGVLHGIVGTMLITIGGLLFALPVGLLAGVFLAEYPKNSLATFVRFCTDVLSGAPSIVVGVVAYILIVVQYRQFSGVAGSIAIAFLMVPTIVRTTEEVLKLVPETTREAALALGTPMWYSTFTVVVPTALSGIVTGVMLAFARGAGETAPLIMTVLGSNVLSFDMFEAMAALPLITYRYTESPFPGENTQAWGTAFVLMILVLMTNILVRLATRSRLRGR